MLSPRFSNVLKAKSKSVTGSFPIITRRATRCTARTFYVSSSKPSYSGLKIVSAFALGSIFATGTGFYFLKDQLFPTFSEEPKYGSARDFQTAIQDLHSVFPEGRVSTDGADLHDHGFSLNDYHPGEG